MDRTPEQESNTPSLFFRNFARLVVYTVLAGAFFFLMAVLVFSVRTRDPQRTSMKDLVGKYYIDVHNELARLRLRIHIDKRRFDDRPPGVILYQSVAPGATLRPGDSLSLTVNQPEPLVRVPELTGGSLEAARSVLARINYDDEVYSMEIGAVTTVAMESVPAGTIVAQFPEAGDMALIEEKMYLLISANPARQRRSRQSINEPEDLQGQKLSILNDYFHHTGLQYRITDFVAPEGEQPDGLVSSVEKGPDGIYRVKVTYSESEVRFPAGYEKISVNLKEADRCEIMVRSMEPADSLEAREKQVYQTGAVTGQQKIDILFYRRGEVVVRTLCDGVELSQRTIRPNISG